MNIIKMLSLIPALLPGISDAIRQVETLFPDGGQGAAKLAAVRGLLDGVVTASGEFSVEFGELWPVLERTVAGLVAAFNAAGIFKSAAKVVATVAETPVVSVL